MFGFSKVDALKFIFYLKKGTPKMAYPVPVHVGVTSPGLVKIRLTNFVYIHVNKLKQNKGAMDAPEVSPLVYIEN